MFVNPFLRSFAIGCFALALGLAGCAGGGRIDNATAPAGTAGVASPAAKKCVRDGYLLEPVMENGVPVGHWCLDPETGRSCEVWRYFRGECSLTR